jgi:acyl carrier protein
MDSLEARLARCFSAVFPNLSPDQIRSASPETVDGWDSLKAVTLIEVVQEQFGVTIDPLAWPDLEDFDAFANYLAGHAAPS